MYVVPVVPYYPGEQGVAHTGRGRYRDLDKLKLCPMFGLKSTCPIINSELLSNLHLCTLLTTVIVDSEYIHFFGEKTLHLGRLEIDLFSFTQHCDFARLKEQGQYWPEVSRYSCSKQWTKRDEFLLLLDFFHYDVPRLGKLDRRCVNRSVPNLVWKFLVVPRLLLCGWSWYLLDPCVPYSSKFKARGGLDAHYPARTC